MPRRRPKKVPISIFLVGRAAVLYQRGDSTREVLDYFFQRYGKAWGVTRKQLYAELFATHPGTSTNFEKRFGNKTPEQIQEAFSAFMESMHTRRVSGKARMQTLKKDPIYIQAKKKGTARLFRDPVFRSAHSEKHRKIMKRLWKDPSFVEATKKSTAGILANLWKDPEFRKRGIARGKKVLARINAARAARKRPRAR